MLLSALAAAILLSSPVLSQERSNFRLDDDVAIEAGLSSDEIVSRFGKPDRKQESKQRKTQSWWYGKSVVFFEESRVTAWTSGSGELAARQRKVIKKHGYSNAQAPYSKNGWSNAWQRSEPVNSDKILEGLLQPEKSTNKF